jgi:hypothetical protein
MREVKARLARVLGFRAANRSAPLTQAASVKGTFADFLAKLLTFESGIDPEKFAGYVSEYESPVMRYPRVSSPGRVIRERQSGSYRFEPMTVAAYFKTLGVNHLFDPASPACIPAMQYASTNVLGFVGYQFGEAALIAGGSYRPQVVRGRRRAGGYCEYDSYYIGSLPETTWCAGRTETLYRLPGTRKDVLATDVNRWQGTFTGKNGIASLDDFKDPQRQELAMRDHLDANHTVLRRVLSRNGFDLRAAPRTWSGLLAAAHLCGASAAAAFALRGTIARDEFKTDIATYFAAFEGYETPYCSPVRQR